MSRLAEIEALLFIAGEEGLTLSQMAELLDLPMTGLVQSLDKLADKYLADTDSSLTLLQSSKRYRLVTKAVHADLLRRYSRTPINQSMSRALLETLSIVAYKQPITRLEVDDIRGVNSSGALTKLLAFNLIEDAGRKEVIGRPRLYRTTDDFLDFIGVNSLEELPEISDLDLSQEEGQLFSDKSDPETAEAIPPLEGEEGSETDIKKETHENQ